MANSPIFKDFRKEDYQEAPSWFGRFLLILNNFSNSVATALSKNLTFAQNFQCTIKEWKFSTLATYTSGDWNVIQFNSDLPAGVKVQGVQILQILDEDQLPIVSQNGQVPAWVADSGVVSIYFISGLDNSTTYNVRFLVT